jgi:hypothetical protein
MMKYFYLCHIQTGCGTYPASFSVVPGALSLVIKGLGHEADCSLASSAEVKNAWGYTSTPPYILMAWS